MKSIKRIIMTILVIVMTVSLATPVTTEAASKPRLNRSKATLIITSSDKHPTVILSVYGTSKKPKWSTSNKKVATVKKGEVTAKKAGKATITCKVGKKKLTCKISVLKEKNTSGCKHDWKKNWKTFKTNGSYTGNKDAYFCYCGVFFSEKKFKNHLQDVTLESMFVDFTQKKMGIHGKWAKCYVEDETVNDLTTWSIRTKYVTSMRCKKCGKKVTIPKSWEG